MSLHFTRRVGASIVALVVLATACGGGGDDEGAGEVTLRTAGEISVDETELASTTTTTEAVAAATGAGETGDAEAIEQTPDETVDTTTTLPQEELDPGEALFQAIGVFQSCLDADGFEFIGIPFQEDTDPEAPVNQQPYIDALLACAARSQIQERIAAVDEAQQDLTPDEVEEQNRQFIGFRDCMIGRGWDIPEPVPDERGLLFGGLGSTGEWVGPAGENIATTDDVGECTAEAGVTLGGG